MLNRKSFFFFSLLLLISYVGIGQNLCGIWFGYGYSCYSIDPDGNVNFYSVPVEIISITQQGNLVIATKVVGDSCVTAGAVTWEGEDTASIFAVTATTGDPMEQNCCTESVEIQIIDSNELELLFLGISATYIKATCQQIDSMVNLFTDKDISCANCGLFSMPNVFTPNNDGINDIFKPNLCQNILNYELKIYSRWGNIVFSSSNSAQGWDGTNNGENSSAGVYYWECDYETLSQEQMRKKGYLQLIR